MKYLTFAIMTLLLSGCGMKMDNVVDDNHYTVSDFSTVCLDGTAYWVRAAGHRGFMAVRIDPQTREPMRCDR